MATINDVISDLSRLESNAEKLTKKLAEEIKGRVVANIKKNPGIKTRAYVNSVNEHLVGDNQYLIDTSDNNKVTYDGFLEFQTANRGNNGVRAGRYYNERAILQTDFEQEIDLMIRDSLSHATVI